jgi:hypothetical protein
MRYSGISAGQAQKARARLKKPLPVARKFQSDVIRRLCAHSRRPRAVRLALLRAEGAPRILPLHRVPSLAVARLNEIFARYTA